MHPTLLPRRLAAAPIVAAIAACTGSGFARADGAMSTDRPDFVESSEVVGRGRFQIETSFLNERDSSGGVDVRTRTTPTLLRFGVGERVELRLETDGFASSSVRDATTGASQSAHGFADVSLGAKWHTQDGDEARNLPSVAWLLHVDVDSGSAPFRGQGLRPSLRMVAEWELPHDMSVGVMPGVLLDRNAAGGRYASGIFAVTLGQEWTPAWHGFVELAGQSLASKRNGGSVVTLDAGIAWLVTESLQLDISAWRALTSEAPDLQWGVGLSARF